MKKSALDKGCMQLKASIMLYRQTTETLMAEFMKEAASQSMDTLALAIKIARKQDTCIIMM